MINGLATIFKQLNDLVIDQGTILDRIDYNVEQTVSNIQKANVQLRKVFVKEYQRLMSIKILLWQKDVLPY